MVRVSRRRRKRAPQQGSLDFDAGKHGGRREGAGRPEGPNPRLWHRSRDEFSKAHPLHVTVPIRRGIPSLRSHKIVRAIEAAFRRGCERAGFRLVHYSLQDDHVHLIVEADGVAALGRGMKSITSRLAYAVNRALRRGRRGKVIADRYHHEVLSCPRQVRNALAYVLLNARRHAAKRIARLRKQGKSVQALAPARYLDAPSSARWFDGWREDARVDRSPPRLLGSEPAVAPPQTWFLRVGWRRHGLIDPSEIPALARR
jgi:REP element-mobilizing transposase RayT